MNKQHKRIFSGLMAIVMLLAMMTVPAFADTTIEGSYQDSDIKVLVPSTGNAVINPLGLPVQLRANDATDGDLYGTIAGAQIVTKPLYIINQSEVNLKIFANAVAETHGNIRLEDQSFDSATNDGNSAFVYLQIALTDLDHNDATQGDLDPAKFYPVFADWEEAAYDEDTDLVVGSRAADEAKQLLILKASKDLNDDETLDSNDWQVGSIGMFRLAGVVSEEPRTAWTVDDGFTATITFTFKPDMTEATISAGANKIEITGTASTTLTPHLSIGDDQIVSVEWDDSELPYGVELAAATGNTATLKVVTGAAETTGAVTVKAVVTAKNGLTYEAEFTGVEVVGDVKLIVDATTGDLETTNGNITLDATNGNLTVKYSSGGNSKSQEFASVKWTYKGTLPAGVSISGDNTATLAVTVTAAQASIKPQKITFTAEVMDKNGATHTVTATVTVIGTKAN